MIQSMIKRWSSSVLNTHITERELQRWLMFFIDPSSIIYIFYRDRARART